MAQIAGFGLAEGTTVDTGVTGDEPPTIAEYLTEVLGIDDLYVEETARLLTALRDRKLNPAATAADALARRCWNQAGTSL